MAGRRLSMRKIKEILRLKWQNGCSDGQIAGSCKIARSTVREYLRRAQEAGLTWPLEPDLDDRHLENLLFPVREAGSCAEHRMPSMEYLFRELKRKRVTLQLLWYEYKQVNPEGYQYSQFCHLYRQWVKKLDVTLRQEHRAGEKLFIDYAGQTAPIVDRSTGEIIEAQIFIATLGASNYTFAEATVSQDLPSWINSHVRAFEFFQGVAEILVPDNLKAGVSSPCRYEPDINPTYQDLAQHYGAVVIPARPGKEGIRLRWNPQSLWLSDGYWQHLEITLSLASMSSIRPLVKNWGNLTIANSRSLKPPAANCLRPWTSPLLNPFHHPYQLARQQVDVRLTSTTVEILFKNRRLTSHKRSYVPGQHTTLNEHMPKSHQRYREWTPSRIIRWAGENGPKTKKLVSRILDSRPHPEQGYRSCLGIISLAKHYSPERLENACSRALIIKGFSYKSVKSILKNGLDQQPLLFDHSENISPLSHDNIRGKHYYQQKEAPNAH